MFWKRFASRNANVELALARCCSSLERFFEECKITPLKAIFIDGVIVERKTIFDVVCAVRFRAEKVCACELATSLKFSAATAQPSHDRGEDKRLGRFHHVFEENFSDFMPSLRRSLEHLGYDADEKIAQMGDGAKRIIESGFRKPEDGDPTIFALSMIVKHAEQQKGLNAKHSSASGQPLYTHRISSKSLSTVHISYRGERKVRAARDFCKKNGGVFEEVGRDSCLILIEKKHVERLLTYDDALREVFFTSDRESVKDPKLFVVNYVRLFSFFDRGSPVDDSKTFFLIVCAMVSFLMRSKPLSFSSLRFVFDNCLLSILTESGINHSLRASSQSQLLSPSNGFVFDRAINAVPKLGMNAFVLTKSWGHVE